MTVVPLLILHLFLRQSEASELRPLDEVIRTQLKLHHIEVGSIQRRQRNKDLYLLGQKLFGDTILSGNRRVSCQTCHDPKKATSDGLPLSRTEDARGILRRNTPALFNVGTSDKLHMFWDGRVQYDPVKKIFNTPEPALNGQSPKAAAIAKAMSSALSAQALFPLVAEDEMLGKPGENEIADAKDHLEAWSLLVERLLNNGYAPLFKRAFSDIPLKKINIGHVAEAIAYFEKEKFLVLNTPFQRYVRGDHKALSADQKRGLFLFLGSARCVRCHSGPDLGNNSLFASIATPQWGKAPLRLDTGRFEVSKNEKQKYAFKVPSLLNVALTAPYMHNGAFTSLKEVIAHYDFASRSLFQFDLSDERRERIPVPVEYETSKEILKEIWLSSQPPHNPPLKELLMLTPLERHYLEKFLAEGLLDSSWAGP